MNSWPCFCKLNMLVVKERSDPLERIIHIFKTNQKLFPKGQPQFLFHKVKLHS